MTYEEYRENRQTEFNALPIFFAFSNEQFEKALNERGVTLEDAPNKVCKYGYGGFYLKSDADIIKEYHKRDRDSELREMMNKDLDFAYGAFKYEMYNHEYPINWQGDWDVCNCFGECEYSDDKYGVDYLRELGFSEAVIGQYYKARRVVWANDEW